MKKTLIWTTSRFAALITLLVILTACAALPRDPTLYPPAPGESTVTVYVASNLKHTNLVLPRSDITTLSPVVAHAAELIPESPWVAVGWGDRSYYRERGETWGRRRDGLRALFTWGNPSVLHIKPIEDVHAHAAAGHTVYEIQISQEGFERLVQKLEASFTLENGAPIPAGFGRRPDSLFFESVESFGAMYSCNQWIAALLHEAGVPSTPMIDTRRSGFEFDLRWRAGAERVAVEGAPIWRPYVETPPAHSGRWLAMDDSTRTIAGEVTLDSYTVAFDRAGTYETGMGELLPADRPYAELLAVREGSLINSRPVTRRPPAERLCGSEPVSFLIFGFRSDRGKRYEIAIAAYAEATTALEPCAVLQFRQP